MDEEIEKRRDDLLKEFNLIDEDAVEERYRIKILNAAPPETTLDPILRYCRKCVHFKIQF